MCVGFATNRQRNAQSHCHDTGKHNLQYVPPNALVCLHKKRPTRTRAAVFFRIDALKKPMRFTIGQS
jgi:hypothetical protein